MTSAADSLDDEDMSINRTNRHQYYETAIASASDADREIRMAEARGRERQLREDELRRSIKRVAWRLLALLILGGASLALWLARRH